MKKLSDFHYTESEAKMIVTRPRKELHETYREASAAVLLYQQENLELEDSYLVLLLQGLDPEGIFSKDVKKEPEPAKPRGLTDPELEQYWRSLDPAIKSLGSMYLAPGVIRTHEKIITEGVAYVISEVGMLRQQPALTPSALAANYELAQTLLKRTLNALKAYLNSGIYSINPDSIHVSEGGDGILDVQWLSEADRNELLAIRDARTKARYDALAEHTRVPLKPQPGVLGLVDNLVRECTFGDCQVRAIGGVRGAGRRRIEALVPYNSPAKLYDFVEILIPGCFAGALSKNNPIAALWNHDSSMPLASTRNNTLILDQRKEGLFYTIYPNLQTTWGSDCWEAVKRGDIAGTSFSFTIDRDGGEKWPAGEKIDGLKVRRIVKIDELFEVSPCTFPSYKSSQIVAKGGE